MAARTEALGYARTHARQTDRCTVDAVPASILPLISCIHQSRPQLLPHPNTLRGLLFLRGERSWFAVLTFSSPHLIYHRATPPPREEMTWLHGARSRNPSIGSERMKGSNGASHMSIVAIYVTRGRVWRGTSAVGVPLSVYTCLLPLL